MSKRNKIKIQIVVLLEVKDKISFEEFERKAINIMTSYDGKLISAFEPVESESTRSSIDEIHCLEFPNIEAFNNYRKDPELLELASLRNKAISNTIIYISERLKHYIE